MLGITTVEVDMEKPKMCGDCEYYTQCELIKRIGELQDRVDELDQAEEDRAYQETASQYRRFGRNWIKG